MATAPEYKTKIDRVALEPGKFTESPDGTFTATEDDVAVDMWHEWPPPDPEPATNKQVHQLKQGDKVVVTDHGSGLTIKIKPA